MARPLAGGITIRCTRSRGPRGFFYLHVDRRGPVIVDVIPLGYSTGLPDETRISISTVRIVGLNRGLCSRCLALFATLTSCGLLPADDDILQRHCRHGVS